MPRHRLRIDIGHAKITLTSNRSTAFILAIALFVVVAVALCPY